MGPAEHQSDNRWQEWWRKRGERELQCILMTAWDPIGVGDVPEAWDEYESRLANARLAWRRIR